MFTSAISKWLRTNEMKSVPWSVKSVLWVVFYLSQGIMIVLDASKTRKWFGFYLYTYLFTHFTYKTNILDIWFHECKTMQGNNSETARAYAEIWWINTSFPYVV